MENKKQLTLVLTESCNMRCKYCFEAKCGYPNTFMSLETVDKSINLFYETFDFKNENLESDIEFFGGEPTLNPEAIKFVCNHPKVLEHKPRIRITTNMLVINHSVMEILNEYAKNYNGVYMTISGVVVKRLHDKDRIDVSGKGTFDRIFNNIKELKKYKYLYYGIHTVLSRDIIPYFTEIVDEYFKIKNEYNLRFNSFALISPYSSDDFIYSKEDLKYIYEDYINRDKSKICDYDLENIYFPICPSISFYHIHVNKCNIYSSAFTILPNGDVAPCHKSDVKYEGFIMGNINHLNSKTLFNLLNKYNNTIDITKTISELNGKKCSECDFSSMCHTCLVNNHTITGDYNIKAKEECYRTMTIAELTMEYERLTLMKEQNELLKTIILKIDQLGNLNVNIAEGVQLILNDKINKDKE